MTIGKRLGELKERSGLTLDEIATAANYRGRSSVQKFFSTDYDPSFLDGVVAHRLARAFVGRGVPPITEDEVFSLAAISEKKVEQYQFSEMNNLRRDVAVYFCLFAKTKSFSGQIPVSLYAMELDNPVSYLWHPPGLTEEVIFGLQFHGVPLLPRYRPGETVFLSATAQPRYGDDVCITFNKIEEASSDRSTSTVAVFGTLLKQDARRYYFRTIDTDEEFSFAIGDVEHLQRLVTIGDALARNRST